MQCKKRPISIVFGWVLLLLLALLLTACVPLAGDRSARPGNGTETVAGVEVPAYAAPYAGRHFKIAVVQKGDRYLYAATLAGVYKSLGDLGWVNNADFSDTETMSFGEVFAKIRNSGGIIEFPDELYIDLDEPDISTSKLRYEEILHGRSDADLVLALGYAAGTVAAENARKGSLAIPVLIEAVQDPVANGMIESYEDSGYDLLSATCDPGVYDRQIRLFHQVAAFKRLGVVYSGIDSVEADTVFSEIEKTAKEIGFTVLAFKEVAGDLFGPAHNMHGETRIIEGVHELALKVDAIYLALQPGLNLRILPKVLDIAYSYDLPTFAMEGNEMVRRGVLLGETRASLESEGLHTARNMVKILQGAKPRTLAQPKRHISHIAVNLAAAREIAFPIPVSLVLSADEVFSEVSN